MKSCMYMINKLWNFLFDLVFTIEIVLDINHSDTDPDVGLEWSLSYLSCNK